VTDLFDTLGGGEPSPEPAPESAALEPIVEEKNRVLAEEEAAAEPEELTGTAAEAEDVTIEEGKEESGENAAGDEILAAASGTASAATSQPAPQKPVNVVEEDVYEFDKCLITVAMGLMPDDGDLNGRLVMLGVRNHQDEPILSTCRLNDLMPLPDPIQQLIEQLKEQLPARSEKAAAKKAKAKEDEEKRKATGNKTKTPVKTAPKKAEKPKPTSMNLFDMFDQKSKQEV
jgi:cell division septation protein DedD